VRAARAEATRRQILAAADRLCRESGFPAVTMEVIAREAGVSVASVYQHFAGRVAIVEGLVGAVVTAPDLSVERVIDEADPVAKLQLGAQIIRQLNERAWPIVDILRDARGSDERLAAFWVGWQEGHLAAMRRAVASIAEAGVLRAGLSADEAADILCAVAGPEVYRALVRERGWSAQRYEEWLFRTACTELLG
jgi:AcrR family transcriptional regulator